MNILKKHILYLFTLFVLVFLCSVKTENAFAQPSININSFSYNSSLRQNVLLKYSKIDNIDRFTFDFPPESKISYDIKSDGQNTKIIFSRIFRLEMLNLTSFPQYSQITQRKISSRQLEVTFPLPLVSSIEHLNSVILDLSSEAKIDDNKTQKITPLQISSLSFSWNTPVALAVFKREKYLWIVFNQYQQVDTDELIKDAGNIVKDILQLPHNTATILRLEAADELYSEVRKEGLLWVIDLYNKKTERSIIPIHIATDTTFPGKPSIVVSLPHTGDIFSFLDPEVGDLLMAVTSSDPGHALLAGYKYPDFEFLPSSQGIAINSDDFGINVIRNASGFLLQTTQHPLNITPDIELMKQRSIREAGKTGINIIQDLKVPIIKKNFAESEQYLRDQVALVSESEKNNLRIELARFYLSYGLGSNAMGVLRKISDFYTAQKEDIPPRIKSLLGVASFLMKRYSQAFEYFNSPELALNSDIIFWSNLSNFDNEKDFASQILMNISFFNTYPVAVRKHLFIRAMEYAIKKNNDNLIQKLLTLMDELPKTSDFEAALNYYEAEKIRIQGYIKSALPQYKNVAMSSSNYFSALARYRIADFNSRLADIKQNKNIFELERLKFAWGEKKFKIKVLNKLVDLYLKTDNFYQALRTLHLISTLSPKKRPLVEQRMIQIMEELYYYNNDNQISPIKALALFDDFKYLIKQSPYQTAIIIKLADRLVAVDLLDRAYKLIDNYLQSNSNLLSHQEISAMGSRLALINMFKHDDVSALANLRETEYDDISETLAIQRKIIEAKAYIQLGNQEKALELLKDNTSRNAILLKADIYWSMQQWDEASDMIKLLINKPQPDEALSEEQIHYILDWLTALKQAGKETVIIRVRNTFKPYFDKTSYASIFNILTDRFEKDKISLKDINSSIQNVQAFSNFAKLYINSLFSENIAPNDESKQ